MKAITTKFLGPANVRGARVKAVAADGDRSPPSVTLPWDHSLNAYSNHEAAAKALVVKMGWRGTWRGGSVTNGWVFVNGEEGFIVE